MRTFRATYVVVLVLALSLLSNVSVSSFTSFVPVRRLLAEGLHQSDKSSRQNAESVAESSSSSSSSSSSTDDLKPTNRVSKRKKRNKTSELKSDSVKSSETASSNAQTSASQAEDNNAKKKISGFGDEVKERVDALNIQKANLLEAAAHAAESTDKSEEPIKRFAVRPDAEKKPAEQDENHSHEVMRNNENVPAVQSNKEETPAEERERPKAAAEAAPAAAAADLKSSKKLSRISSSLSEVDSAKSDKRVSDDTKEQSSKVISEESSVDTENTGMIAKKDKKLRQNNVAASESVSESDSAGGVDANSNSDSDLNSLSVAVADHQDLEAQSLAQGQSQSILAHSDNNNQEHNEQEEAQNTVNVQGKRKKEKPLKAAVALSKASQQAEQPHDEDEDSQHHDSDDATQPVRQEEIAAAKESVTVKQSKADAISKNEDRTAQGQEKDITHHDSAQAEDETAPSSRQQASARQREASKKTGGAKTGISSSNTDEIQNRIVDPDAHGDSDPEHVDAANSNSKAANPKVVKESALERPSDEQKQQQIESSSKEDSENKDDNSEEESPKRVRLNKSKQIGEENEHAAKQERENESETDANPDGSRSVRGNKSATKAKADASLSSSIDADTSSEVSASAASSVEQPAVLNGDTQVIGEKSEKKKVGESQEETAQLNNEGIEAIKSKEKLAEEKKSHENEDENTPDKKAEVLHAADDENIPVAASKATKKNAQELPKEDRKQSSANNEATPKPEDAAEGRSPIDKDQTEAAQQIVHAQPPKRLGNENRLTNKVPKNDAQTPSKVRKPDEIVDDSDNKAARTLSPAKSARTRPVSGLDSKTTWKTMSAPSRFSYSSMLVVVIVLGFCVYLGVKSKKFFEEDDEEEVPLIKGESSGDGSGGGWMMAMMERRSGKKKKGFVVSVDHDSSDDEERHPRPKILTANASNGGHSLSMSTAAGTSASTRASGMSLGPKLPQHLLRGSAAALQTLNMDKPNGYGHSNGNALSMSSNGHGGKVADSDDEYDEEYEQQQKARVKKGLAKDA